MQFTHAIAAAILAYTAIAAPAGAPHSEVGTPLVQGNCDQLDTYCRTQTGANMSLCSSNKAKCLAECDNDDNTCRVAPNANMSTCSANKAQCYGFNPYN